MTHHTEQCCKECSGWEPALHECSCQCHYSPTDESVVDWEKEFDGWANNVVEHDSERGWVKTFIRNILTSKEAQHKAEVETARKEEREQGDYNTSMAVQAIDFYLAKDGEEYGVTPLHSKLHAYISSGKWWKNIITLTNKES